jgi:hypothetical protein
MKGNAALAEPGVYIRMFPVVPLVNLIAVQLPVVANV